VLSCQFKTELASTLLQLTSASINLVIGPLVDYAKKKEKRAQIKFVKDETVQKDDQYKSHTVHVPSGEPPNSRSRPPAKRKAGVVRPITQGKLLKSSGRSKPTGTRRKPATQPLPGSSRPSTVTKPTASRADLTTSRAPPPPPSRDRPPPSVPEEPGTPMYRAKYAFEGQAGELSLAKDDLVELVEKDENGWWLVKKDGLEGWAPSNYLELVPPKPKAAPAPPPAPPPAPRRPLAPPAAPAVAPKPTAPQVQQQPRIPVQSLTADASAKPVSVFPGMAPPNGTAAPWKKTLNVSAGTTPATSRPTSAVGAKPPPPAPPVGKKPAPPPPVASKPAPPKPPGRPPVPTATRPTPAPSVPRPGAIKPSGSTLGQMDLAAALAKRAQRIAETE